MSVGRLRGVNERIISELGRIDARLEQIDSSTGSKASVPFQEETQKLIENIQFPSSPCLDEENTPLAYQPDYVMVVTTTMLDQEGKQRVKKWAETFDAIYMPEYNGSVTHVIGKGHAEKLVVRSMKTMQAIADGTWLLPLECKSIDYAADLLSLLWQGSMIV